VHQLYLIVSARALTALQWRQLPVQITSTCRAARCRTLALASPAALQLQIKGMATAVAAATEVPVWHAIAHLVGLTLVLTVITCRGAAPNSKGTCVSCSDTFGKGCTSCTSSSCSARDCSKNVGGADTCSDSRYLSGCTASSVGTCESCAATYGLGCANCTSNFCLDRNCGSSTRTTSDGDVVSGADICTANQYLDGCSAQSKGTCVSCSIAHGKDCTSCSGGGAGDCVTRACTTSACLGCATDYGLGCTNCTGT
jgi:hypothetical protein